MAGLGMDGVASLATGFPLPAGMAVDWAVQLRADSPADLSSDREK
jgi:hypothetical protein